MEKDLRLSLETVKALRSHIYTAKTDDGKDCINHLVFFIIITLNNKSRQVKT